MVVLQSTQWSSVWEQRQQGKAFYSLPCVTLPSNEIRVLYQLLGLISSPSILILEPAQQSGLNKALSRTQRFLVFFQLSFLHRELGGALCAVWSSYIASETKLIFVVDSSNIASISLVGSKSIIDKPDLLIWKRWPPNSPSASPIWKRTLLGKTGFFVKKLIIIIGVIREAII